MILTSLALVATLGAQDALPVLALRSQDRRAECPAYLVQGMASSGGPTIAADACVWSDTSDGAQRYYTDQLLQAGWGHAGGLANVMRFRKGESCIAFSGWPVETPTDNAIGMRDLRQPRPADEPAVFLILQDKPGACPPAGDR